MLDKKGCKVLSLQPNSDFFMHNIKSKITKNNFTDYKILKLFTVQKKEVEINYTGEDVSSDGGALLLKELDNQINLISEICSCIDDERDQRYIHHDLKELLTQRILQIACGYEDANDCDSLKDDQIFKVCSEKLPQSEASLASQPTMSRLENSITRSVLYRMAEALANNFIKSYTDEPPVIIIDCDDTDDIAYGQQEEIVFNDYYGDYCFMPLHIYEGLTGKLITTILKPGRRSKGVNVFAILKRLIKHIRKHWKNTRILLRGDSHFCSPEFMNWTKQYRNVNFITGLTGNKVLNDLSQTTRDSAEKSYKQNGKPVKMYHTFSYKANTWEEEQRVIVKVEVNEKGTNVRYVVTDIRDYRTKQLYETCYCQRGSMELRIKDHKTYLKSDRTSCHRFEANQFRLFLHSAAYVLIHTLQKEVLKNTEYFNATMKTIQLKILKVAAYVKEMKTKIKIELPRFFPEKDLHIKCFQIFNNLRC
jgi:hypothetical protein